MLVRLNNIVLETADIFALYTDQTTKKPVHSVYIRDRVFNLTEEEYRKLVACLKLTVLVKEEEENVKS